VYVRAGLCLLDFGIVANQRFLGRLLELHVLRLRRATAGANFDRARIAAAARRTGPLQPHVTKTFFCHSVSPVLGMMNQISILKRKT
jgi:hypothetical protein